MGLNCSISAMLSLLFLESAAQAKSGLFDVTSPRYGGKPGSDITQALAKTWTDACASTSTSKVLIPRGEYMLTGAVFRGPCKASIQVQVQGTLHAPAEISKITTDGAWVQFQHIKKLTLSGGGTLDGQGSLTWSAGKQKECKRTKTCKIIYDVQFSFVNDSTIGYITSLNSKNFHISVFACNNVTFQHLTISAPGNSVNTDGIHVGHSSSINITDTNIGNGDDWVSIGDGSMHISVRNVTCGPGHGISIGSLGRYPHEEPVAGIQVKNCTLSNTSNGLRIKTWPDSPTSTNASDIHFEDIIVVNVSNPIIIDQEYCTYEDCAHKPPSKVQISDVSYKNVRGSTATPLAMKIVCSKGLPCENVELTDIDFTYNGAKGPLTSLCVNVKPNINASKRLLLVLSHHHCLLCSKKLLIKYAVYTEAPPFAAIYFCHWPEEEDQRLRTSFFKVFLTTSFYLVMTNEDHFFF